MNVDHNSLGVPRVAVDVRGWSASTRGIDLYTSRLLDHWVNRSDVSLTIIAPRVGEIPPMPASVALRRVSLSRALLGTVWGLRSALDTVGRDHDAVFLPNLIVWPRSTRAPLILTSHDATSILNPEFFTRTERVSSRLVNPAALLRTADAVLANSEQTRNELEKVRVHGDRVHVIYHGIGDEFYPRSDVDVQTTMAKLGLPPQQPYFLYLGAVERRKNVRALLRGFAAAQQAGLDARLVIAGSVRDAGELIEATDDVSVLGWIDPEDKAPLYSGAIAAVSLALHEGFGMMPLEAFACRTRSILARLPVYDETIGSNAVYVDNDDQTTIAEALLAQRHSSVGVDSEQSAHLRERFSWSRCADDTLFEIFKVIRARRDA